MTKQIDSVHIRHKKKLSQVLTNFLCKLFLETVRQCYSMLTILLEKKLKLESELDALWSVFCGLIRS
jgi:hypothetical protein